MLTVRHDLVITNISQNIKGRKKRENETQRGKQERKTSQVIREKKYEEKNIVI